MNFHPFYKNILKLKAIKTHSKMTFFKQKILCTVITIVCFSIIAVGQYDKNRTVTNPAYVFKNPPASAKPGALWMWMGSNLSKKGITKDLEALKKAGFNRTTMFSLADVTTPWAGEIKKSPTPDIIAWTEPWWKLVRFAAKESKRLGMDFGMFNCPGYEASGGTWISPELSMQEICWSKTEVKGNIALSTVLERPKVNPRANMMWPVYNPETDLLEKPVIPARKTYYKDIVVLAAPSKGIVAKDSIIDITDKMQADGSIAWKVPEGNWTIYRIGHTTMGAFIQPAQWKATGLECDKMSRVAVEFHINHVIGEIKKHLGDLIGTGFTHVHFDSYEAGLPSWTPKMREEFLTRKGYDLKPYLLTFAGRNVGGKADSTKFRNDFYATIEDLHRDIYFSTLSKKLKEANLTFLCEPYGGPWKQKDIMPLIPNVMTEFWTHNGVFSPYELEPTVEALRLSGQNIVEAEAFTGTPKFSNWTETPNWLKPIGDAAFCAGVNRLILHRYTQQPWDDKFLPGATMGQWGTHFDRTQTWWKEFPAMVKYWQRCQALLQWGKIVYNQVADFSVQVIQGEVTIKSIHRKEANTDIYFIANTSHNKGEILGKFKVTGMQPECWNPVTGEMRTLYEFSHKDGYTEIPLTFEDAQSFFIVFRNKLLTQKAVQRKNFSVEKTAITINQPWKVVFDAKWGGPTKAVVFQNLSDWTQHSDNGIKYYSGTAIYKTTFALSQNLLLDKKGHIELDLGVVKNLAHVKINGHDLGTIWTAPWAVDIPLHILKAQNNQLEISVTNVWANRLIGDEQEPDDCVWLPGHQGGRFLKEFPDWFLQNKPRPSKDRFCFTTWNYFTAQSPLVSSGLIGPVRIIRTE